jgi:putative membrane protein
MPTPGLSAADLDSIHRAVAAAEAESAGEIVPFVVAASDPYPGAAWKGAALGALAAALLAWVAHSWGGFWGGGDFFWMVLPPAAGGALGLLAVHLSPALHRLLAGAEAMELRTRRRAAAAFAEQAVFETAERTGILLFVSLFERRVVVLADRGIHARVEDGEWDAIVGRIVEGIRRGDPGAALAAAIQDCGDLLVRHGLPHPAARRRSQDSAACDHPHAAKSQDSAARDHPHAANQLADDVREGQP